MTEDEFEKLKNQIGVLRLQDGDVLVIKSPRPLTAAHGEALLDRGKKLLQDLDVKGEVIIADAGIELEIIRSVPAITVNVSGPVPADLDKIISERVRVAIEQIERDPRRRQ